LPTGSPERISRSASIASITSLPFVPKSGRITLLNPIRIATSGAQLEGITLLLLATTALIIATEALKEAIAGLAGVTGASVLAAVRDVVVGTLLIKIEFKV